MCHIDPLEPQSYRVPLKQYIIHADRRLVKAKVFRTHTTNMIIQIFIVTS